MNSDQLTIKTREALQQAQQLATEQRHPEVRSLHLLVTLTRQAEGIVGPILQKLGADPRAVAAAARGASRPGKPRGRPDRSPGIARAG